MIPSEIKAAAWAFLLDTLLRFFSVRVTQTLYALPYLPPHLLLGPSFAYPHSRNDIVPEGLAHFQPSFSTPTATSSPSILSHDTPTTTLTPLSPTLIPWALDPPAEPNHVFWFHNPPTGAPRTSQKRTRNVIFPSWVRQQAPAPGEKQHKALAPFSPRIITFCPVLLFVHYALALSAAYLILSVLAMLVAAPFERSSEAVLCDALLVSPGVASLMIRIYGMMEPGTAVARCAVAFPMAALHWLGPIIKEATSTLVYYLCTGTACVVHILVSCLSKVTHMLSSATHCTTTFMVTARRWPLFILHQLYAFLAGCLCRISIGIKAIHNFVQKKQAKKAQIPIITITPAENDEPNVRESVDIAVLLEEISEGTTGLEPLLEYASPSSDDCPEDGVVGEPRIGESLVHISCEHVGGEEEPLVAEQHALLGGQEQHLKCPDHEIRLDAPDEALPGAITGEPEIQAICSRDSGEGVVVRPEGPVAYSPLVPSGKDEVTEIASNPHKAGYHVHRLAPKDRAPGEQPTSSEGGAYQKTIPGSAELALKQGIYDNQDVLSPWVVIDVSEPKGPSQCPGNTSSADESPGDPAVESIKPHRAVQFPLPADSVQATVKMYSLGPSCGAVSEPSLIVQGENDRRLNSITVLPQENSDQYENNSTNKIYSTPGNETFMPEAVRETKESAFISFVPPSSAPRKTNIKKEGSLLTTMPPASIPGEIPSAEVPAQNAQPSISPNTKGRPPSAKEGPTKIASYDKLYSTFNSNLCGQESTSEIWDCPKSGTNAPTHRLLSASIHAPSGQSSEPIHCIGLRGAIESSPAMTQSRRPPHVTLSKDSLNHRAASFTPQGLVLKSTLTRYDPPLRLSGPGQERGDHALNVNLSNPTHSKKCMADLPDHIIRSYGPQPLHSAGAYASHGNVPPRTAVSGTNYITIHRAHSTRGLHVPDWAAEAAAERRSVEMHISAPKASLGTSETRASSLHQPADTTTLRTPIPRDIFTPAPQRVASKVARWAAEVSRVREPATSQILEGSSLDAKVKGCRQGAQQRPLLLNHKANTTLSRDDTLAIFPNTSRAAYHSQRPNPSEFAKRAAETRDGERTKTVQGQGSYYESLCARKMEDIILEARYINAHMGRSPSNGQSPTVSDLSLSEWFSRARDPITGEDIERMIRILKGGY